MIFRGGSEFNDPALDPRRSHNFPLNGFTITPLLFFAAQARVRRDSRLGLDFSYFSVQISGLGLVSVSENHFTEVSVSKKGL